MAGIIGLVAPGGPFSGVSGGDGPIVIPGYMMSQEDSNKIKIKAKLGFNVSIDPSNKILSQTDCDIGSGETIVVLDASRIHSILQFSAYAS